MNQEEGKFIPLQDAAKQLGTSRDYLNVLVHRGKLKAQKMGRNWVTTRQWVDEYLAEKNRGDSELELEKLKLEHELAMAKLNQEVRLREIARQEKLDLARLSDAPAAPAEDPTDEQIEALEMEKQELALLFTQQLEHMKQELEEEKNTKQAMLFAFEHMKEQLHDSLQLRMNEISEYLNEKLLHIAAEQAHLKDREERLASVRHPVQLELPTREIELQMDSNWRRLPLAQEGNYFIAIDTSKIKPQTRITSQGAQVVCLVRQSPYVIKTYPLPVKAIAMAGASLLLAALAFFTPAAKIENLAAAFGTQNLFLTEVGLKWGQDVLQTGRQVAADFKRQTQGLAAAFTSGRTHVLGIQTAAYQAAPSFGQLKEKLEQGWNNFFKGQPYFRPNCRSFRAQGANGP